MGIFEICGTALLVVLCLVTLLWAASIPLKDASLIDIFWGPLFVVTAWVLLAAAGEPRLKPYLVTLLVTIWGLRLAFHLTYRNLGHPEDRRYQLWRQHGGEQWWFKSYYRIFLLQGAIGLMVATPIFAAFYRPDSFGFLNAIGVMVWAAGFAFEMLADIQLTRFKGDSANRGEILDAGLWSLSRHPNYFGDALQWWGLGLVAFTVDTWWALIGPAVMTAVFLSISNEVLERGMRKRNPAYDTYIATTPKFFPFPRRGA